MKVYIDLLPESRKSLMAKKKRFKEIIKQEILFVFPLVIFISMLFATNIIIDVQNLAIESSANIKNGKDKFNEVKLYEEQAKAMNEKVSSLKKFKEGHIKWSYILKDIISLMPEGVSLTDLSTKDYKIFLVGKAADRSILIDLQEKIENSDCFENVVVPLSNLVNKDNVDFQMEFKVKKDCLIDKKDE